MRDVGSLEQVGGVFQCQRHQGSRLVTIDVADPSRPRVLGTPPIAGHVGHGSTQKAGNIIYTVTLQPLGREPLWWRDPDRVKDQAWAVSLDVSDPARPIERSRLPLLKVDSTFEPGTPGGLNRYFSGVSTAFGENVMVVVQNWQNVLNGRDVSVIGSDGRPILTCDYRQESIASVIDIGPDGSLVERTRFQTSGLLASPAALTGGGTADSLTFFGLFREEIKRQPEGFCTPVADFQHRLEAWSLRPSGPQKLDALAFGGPQAQLGLAAVDQERKLAYAVAGKGDSLFTFSLADPTDLRLQSETRELHDDSLGLLRLVGNGQFLLTVGRRSSERCGGPQMAPRRVAVSLIDVRDPAGVRLIQRRCLDRPFTTAENLETDPFTWPRPTRTATSG